MPDNNDKYLDYNGLSTFWNKIKTYVVGKINALTGTVTGTPGASKTVTAISQTNGKLSVTISDIQIAESQVTDLTTHLGQKAPLDSPALTGTPTAPTAAAGTNNTQIATTSFVNTAITNKMAEADAMIYKGTISGGSAEGYGALTTAANKGWTYKVDTAGKILGVEVEVNDMLICNTDSTAAATASNYTTIRANWDFIQGNLDGVVIGPASAADSSVAIFDGATGKMIKDSGFTIGKSVPSDAVFTDTDTKVTSSANHYTPATASGQDKSASASGGTAAWSFDVVKGVTLNTDGKGHVTGISVTSGRIPANPNTDTKVTSVENHYEPAEDSGAEIDASEGSAAQLPTSASGSLVQVVTGIKRDAAGHVVGVTSKGLWSPDTNTTYTNEKLGNGYGTCTTAETTAAKVATLEDYVLVKNGFVAVKFTYGLCAGATLNINSQGAKNIFINGAAADSTTCKEVIANDIAYFLYDGTQYQFLGTDRANKAPIVSITRNGTTFTVTKMDGTTTTFTQQDNDTRNTAGATNVVAKLFLIGAQTQGDIARTYSNRSAFIGPDGCLYSNSEKVLTETVAASTYQTQMTPITDEEIEALN